MPTLHITRGLPGSGKSTWARQWVNDSVDTRGRVNRDDLRHALFNKPYGLTREQENLITKVQQGTVKELLLSGRDVVVDDTNLNAQFAKEWLKVAQTVNAEVEWHDEFLKVPLPVCIERDSFRHPGAGQVGADVIKNMYSRYFRGAGKGPKRPELSSDALPVHARYDGTPGKPKAFLIDLDGTIASNGIDRDHPARGYFDWHRVGEDLPIDKIIEIVGIFIGDGLRPIFVSGRDGSCYEQTMAWILKHVYRYSDEAVTMLMEQDGGRNNFVKLLMREAGDMRKDSIVKLEIFDRELRDKYDVQFCLDDRNQVVDAYRSIGLTVLQVADGNF